MRGKGGLEAYTADQVNAAIFVSVPVRGKGGLEAYPLETIAIFSFQGAVAPLYGKIDVI